MRYDEFPASGNVMYLDGDNDGKFGIKNPYFIMKVVLE